MLWEGRTSDSAEEGPWEVLGGRHFGRIEKLRTPRRESLREPKACGLRTEGQRWTLRWPGSHHTRGDVPGSSG